MFDTHVTVVGNVVAEPRAAQTRDGHQVASFRLASTPRKFDRVSGEWRDGETLFIGVTCWRALAENVMLSLKKGSSVIVMGRLSIRPYETKDGDKRQSVDIDAVAVGPDLGRAVVVIKRTERGTPMTGLERSASEAGQLDEPDDADDGESRAPYPNAAVSTPGLPEPDWGWSQDAAPEGADRVDDEAAPGAGADGNAEAGAEPLAAAGGSAGGGGGRWRRAAS